MDDFAINVHTIKLEYLLGGITRETAISKLAELYANFFGLFTASYEEAMRSDFYIDEEVM